jgi:hypothetical protein
MTTPGSFLRSILANLGPDEPSEPATPQPGALVVAALEERCEQLKRERDTAVREAACLRGELQRYGDVVREHKAMQLTLEAQRARLRMFQQRAEVLAEMAKTAAEADLPKSKVDPTPERQPPHPRGRSRKAAS